MSTGSRIIQSLPLVLAMLLSVGCAVNRVTLTPRSGIEQELLVRSIERAVANLDLRLMAGKRVSVELYTLSGDQLFAREFVSSLLDARGVSVVADPQKAELRLKVIAKVLGVDQGQTLLGLPAFVLPTLAWPIPEISLFKWIRNRGHSDMAIYIYDARADKFVGATPSGVGRSKFDDFTLLVIFSFTIDDLNKPPAQSG